MLGCDPLLCFLCFLSLFPLSSFVFIHPPFTLSPLAPHGQAWRRASPTRRQASPQHSRPRPPFLVRVATAVVHSAFKAAEVDSKQELVRTSSSLSTIPGVDSENGLPEHAQGRGADAGKLESMAPRQWHCFRRTCRVWSSYKHGNSGPDEHGGRGHSGHSFTADCYSTSRYRTIGTAAATAAAAPVTKANTCLCAADHDPLRPHGGHGKAYSSWYI